MPDFVVATLKAEPYAYIERTARTSEIPKIMSESFDTLSALFAKAKASMVGMPLTHYKSFDGETTSFQLGFPVRQEDTAALEEAGLSIGETPHGPAMQAIHIGPYEEVPKTYDALLAEMKARGLEGTTDMWERYFSPPGTPPEQTRTEVICPLRQPVPQGTAA
jgi:AraC family transcriptional regulator